MPSRISIEPGESRSKQNAQASTTETMSYRSYVWRVLVPLWFGCGPVIAQPIITDFTPTAGSPGDQVILMGSGFSHTGISVQFSTGVAVTAGFISSDTLMTVTVPAGISTGPISIQQSGGSPNFSANDFTAIGPGPYITDVSPPYGKPGDLITINGVHLAPVGTTGVAFNGQPSADAAANAAGTQINVHVPSGATTGFISVATPIATSNSPAVFMVLGPGPFISGFSPQVGTPGTTVFIDGVQFTGATSLTFNGVPGVNFSVTSDTLIRVDAPAGVNSGPLTVNSPAGSFMTRSNFFVPPSISGFSPAAGRAGTNVLISGVNFLGAAAVIFNGVAATSFAVLNGTNILAAVPAGASNGVIRVTAPAGSAFSAANFVMQPTLSGFSPAFGPAGTPVVITGANLNAGTPVVRFNGVAAAAPTGVSYGQLTAVVPAVVTTGPISVTTSDGSYTNASLFYLPAAISSFTPGTGAPGTRVTLTGKNFTGATAVSFNGTAATGVTVTNNTTLGVTVPAGFTTGPISITTPAGPVASAILFYAAPLITDLTPSHGLPGTNVTITGSSFLGTTSVRFAGVGAVFTVLNNSQIKATVPNGAVNGPVTVVAPGGTNTSSVSFVLDYFADLAVAITAAPNPVTLGSNLLYTIQVVNNGPLPAPNVRLTNTLPASVALKALTAPPSWATFTNSNSVQAGISTLAVNGSATFQVTAIPRAPGAITSWVGIGSDYLDPAPSNNTASVTTTVNPLPLLSAQLSFNGVQIAWPVALTNYVLESRSTFTTNAPWIRVPGVPSVSGGMYLMTVTNSGAFGFFRLHQ